MTDDRARRRLEALLDRAVAGLPPDARVLDAGGGSGNASLLLCERGFRPLLVDVSPEMVELWEQKARARGFEPASEICTLEGFFAGDDRAWDLIVFSSVLHHIEDPAGLLRAAAAHLAPGGFIVSVFDPLELSRAGRWLRRLDYLCWVLIESPGRVPALISRRLRGHAGHGGEEAEESLGALAELHAMSGLRDDNLIRALTGSGLELIVHDRLSDARFGLFRGLARMLRMQTAFSLVARAPAGPAGQASGQ